MWFDFMIAALSAIVFLFLPGGLFVYSARRSLIEAFGFAPILGLVFLFIGCSFLLLCWDNGLMVVPISPLFCCFSHCFGLSFLQKVA